MNKTYRSIWNPTLGTWVAAPETARRGGGSSVAVPLALASMLLLACMSTQASTVIVTGDVEQSSDLINWTPASPIAGMPWDLGGDYLAVGRDGTGSLDIADGGQVTSGESFVGYDQFNTGASASGTVNVTGTGSSWSTGDKNLIVGVQKGGSGILNIKDGGQVISGFGALGYGIGSGSGTVNVEGAGSKWSIDSSLMVGYGATGTLNIINGGQVASHYASVGYDVFGAGAFGDVKVSGTDSKWTIASNLDVGLAGGTGILNIEDGGQVASGAGSVGRISGTGVVNVTGAGSVWSTGFLSVGDGGTGTLNIGNGGQVTSDEALIGYDVFGTGSGQGAVNVSGAYSKLSITRDLRVGLAGGSGIVNIDQGGAVSAGKVILAEDSGSEGTVNLLGNDPQGRGVLEAGQVIKGEGHAILNLDGGILRATVDQADFLQGFSELELGANGAIFDTNGHDIAVGTGFASRPGQDSGLTKQGAGTLTLNSAANTYAGATEVIQGTLQAGASNVFSSNSAHNVAAGAMLDLAGHDQTLSSLSNSGIVNLSGSTPGAVLKVTGNYVGNNGTLGVSTELGADDSITDKLLLSGTGAIASGHTSIQVTNAGGLGAQTTGNGIVLVATENGASLEPGSFTLAGEHVDAGAYEYRLYQTAQGAALKSTVPTTDPGLNPDPGTSPEPDPNPDPATVAYRSEVALMSALPAQLRQADMAMLGDMHKRMGDESTQARAGTEQGANRRVWGRVLRTDPTIRQQGTVSPESRGHMMGFQAGLDLYADKNVKAGLYVGQLEGDMSTTGFASGVENKYVGFNSLLSRYLGVYGTWQDDSGLYADAVLQGASYRSNLHTAGDIATATTKGNGWLASLEVGKPYVLNSNWQVEPQAQLIYRKLNLSDTALSMATVQNQADDDWTLRLGARIKGSFATQAGVLHPYGRINVYKSSSTTDVARFVTPAAYTDIRAQGGYLSTELAAGASLQLNKDTSLYGELGKLWSNGGDSRVKSGVQASIGVKVLW